MQKKGCWIKIRHVSISSIVWGSYLPNNDKISWISSLLYGTSGCCSLSMDTGAPCKPRVHCMELAKENQTIVIDRAAEETPNLTSTHAESNYTLCICCCPSLGISDRYQRYRDYRGVQFLEDKKKNCLRKQLLMIPVCKF